MNNLHFLPKGKTLPFGVETTILILQTLTVVFGVAPVVVGCICGIPVYAEETKRVSNMMKCNTKVSWLVAAYLFFCGFCCLLSPKVGNEFQSHQWSPFTKWWNPFFGRAISWNSTLWKKNWRCSAVQPLLYGIFWKKCNVTYFNLQFLIHKNKIHSTYRDAAAVNEVSADTTTDSPCFLCFRSNSL